MTPNELRPADLARVIVGFRDALRANQEALNRLNVYPVPDGDTGTNMALTLESVVTALAALDDGGTGDGTDDGSGGETDDGGTGGDMAAVCTTIANASLMGARGNSGVIVSQILRGVAATCKTLAVIDAHTFVAALRAGTTGAYGAVAKPVEGTILTVVRGATEAAEAHLSANPSSALLEVVDVARAGAAEALASTPELLPVLKQAGVVDSGGSGLLLLLDAMLHVLDGRPVPDIDAPGTQVPAALSVPGTVGSDAAKHVSELRYEVMYLLDAPDESIGGFKDVWASIGDSIVVIGGDGLFNCHIHTDDIGAAIEAAIDIGRPRSIRVTDLLEEVEEERWVREARGEAIVGEPPHVHTPCTTAVVAVATGDGVRRLFLSVGVQQIVAGGQSMNPSTAQLLAAVEACPARSVVILPNNKNIIAVAEQVAALTEKSVRVVRTRGVTEGLAAAMQYDPEGDVDDNAASMTDAVRQVVSGELTTAVRDSQCDAGPIRAGDHLGIAHDGGIISVAASLADAATGLLATLVNGDHEIVTIIEGDGASAADTRRITEWLADHRPGATPEVHHGGQPLYPYLFGVE